MRVKKSGGRRPKISKKGPFKLGEETEYRIARLFVWMGYFVRRGREIYTKDYLDQATDLDVLAIRYHGLFSREVVTVESKTGRDGPLDRIFWLSGLRRYVDADRAMLYRRPTKWNIRAFAKEVGVEIFDPERLEKLEKRYVPGEKGWIGLCDWPFLKPRVEAWNRVLARDKKYRELFQTLVTEVKYEDPFALIAFWIYHLRGLTRNLSREDEAGREVVRFLISDAVGQLGLSVLRVAQMTADLTAHDRHGMIESHLIYGEQEPVLVKRVFQRSYQIAKAVINEKLGGGVDIDGSLFDVPTPDYVSEMCQLLEEIVQFGGYSNELPQIADLIMAERFLKTNQERPFLKRVFPSEGLRYRVVITQRFLQRLCDLECLPEEVGELLKMEPPTGESDDGKELPKQGSFLENVGLSEGEVPKEER